jgi:hypothetical protein
VRGCRPAARAARPAGSARRRRAASAEAAPPLAESAPKRIEPRASAARQEGGRAPDARKAPHGEKASATTGLACPGSLRAHLRVETSHILMPEAAETSTSSSGCTARRCAGCFPTLRLHSSAPLLTCHAVTCPSADAAYSVAPETENARCVTLAVCPVPWPPSDCRSSPRAQSHSMTFPICARAHVSPPLSARIRADPCRSPRRWSLLPRGPP